MSSVLREYIRFLVAEALDRADEDDTIDEFCAVGGGAIAGYTAPLGADPDKLGRKKNAVKK